MNSDRDRLLREHVGFTVTVLTSIKAIMQDAHGETMNVPLSYTGEFVDYDGTNVFVLQNDGSTVTVSRKFIVAVEALSESNQAMNDPSKPKKTEMS
jgi:hypothetical protein